MARSTLLVCGLLFVGCIFAAETYSKPHKAMGDTFVAEWKSPEYIGFLPSLKTSIGVQMYPDAQDFDNVPLTYQGPTSTFSLELDGNLLGGEALQSFFVSEGKLADLLPQIPLTGLVQYYVVPWPTNDDGFLEVYVITSTLDAYAIYGLLLGEEGPNMEPKIGNTQTRQFIPVNLDSPVSLDSPGSLDGISIDGSPSGLEEITDYSLDEINRASYTIITWYRTENPSEFDPITPDNKSIKVKFLLDLDVNHDDGPIPIVYDEEQGTFSNPIFQESRIPRAPMVRFFSEQFFISDAWENFRDYLNNRDIETFLNLDVNLVGTDNGADEYQYANWKNAIESDEFHYYIPEEEGQEEGSVVEIRDAKFGELLFPFFIDDAALIAYFDGSKCWGENGYPVLEQRIQIFNVKLGLYLGRPEESPRFHCPYCSSNVLPFKRQIPVPSASFFEAPKDAATDSHGDLDHCYGDVGTGRSEECRYIQYSTDADPYPDACDYCPLQFDFYNNGDADSDGFGNNCDNCPTSPNPSQWDQDEDGLGNTCDNCEAIFNEGQSDQDEDGVGNVCDNCEAVYNPSQYNGDGDSHGDACDNCDGDDNEDQENTDGDSYGNVCDNCPYEANDDQADYDSDTVGDVCDNCPEAANEDQVNNDQDTLGDACDNCRFDDNQDQADYDSDTVGDVCDNCPEAANEGQDNNDRDSLGDACDNCPRDDNEDQADSDDDTVGDVCDNCEHEANPDQEDYDHDNVGDVCDNCPEAANEDQLNSDSDSLGDVCDNCPNEANEDQDDSDDDDVGNACDLCPGFQSSDNRDTDGDSYGNPCDYYPESFPAWRDETVEINGKTKKNVQIHQGYYLSDYKLKIKNGASIYEDEKDPYVGQRNNL